VTAKDGLRRFDGQSTPFAAVLDRPSSMETLARIGSAPSYGTNPETATADGMFRMRDHPYPRVLIRRVAIVTNEKVDDDHDWDTSRVGTDEAEPWEADLEDAPLPSEFAGPQPDESGGAPGAGDGNRDDGEDSEDEGGGSDDETDSSAEEDE
jgi:hypothetical protein